MSIERFKRHAGERHAMSADDPTMVLYGDVTPLTVRLPANLGGEVRVVERQFVAPCACGGGHEVQHTVLGDISVAECHVQFLWYRTPPRKTE